MHVCAERLSTSVHVRSCVEANFGCLEYVDAKLFPIRETFKLGFRQKNKHPNKGYSTLTLRTTLKYLIHEIAQRDRDYTACVPNGCQF